MEPDRTYHMAGELICFIGLPASGKSTLCNQMIEDGEVDEVVSADDIRFYTFETQFDPQLEPQVWSIVKARIGKCLSGEKRCLLDATNVDMNRRHDILAIAEYFGAKKKAIVLNIDFDIAMSRNKRHPIKVNGNHVRRTVPNYAMYRMRYQWDESGLGNTVDSIKDVLKDEFDEVEVINRYADDRDCEAMGGTKRFDSNLNRYVCEVKTDDDVGITKKTYFME